MGKNRFRNRPRRPPGAPPPKRPGMAARASIVPACPGGERPGLDPATIATIQQLDVLVGELRQNIGVPNGVWDEESAVKRYLAYLSILVDVGLTDIVISAIHGNDLAVVMKQRMLVEYSAKGMFYSKHPDYALHLLTIDEARSIRQKQIQADPTSKDIADLTREWESMKQRFAHVAESRPLSLKGIMQDLTIDPLDPTSDSNHDAYVWLYGAPSALMHGEPEGMRFVFERDEQGYEHPRVRVSDDQLNAMIVDAGANALRFCEAFADAYHPNNQGFAKRLEEIEIRFLVLTLRHPKGRDEPVLEDIRELLKSRGVDFETFSIP